MNKSKNILISWQSYNPHSQLLGEAFQARIYFIKDLIKSRKLVWSLFFFIDYLYKSLKTIWILCTTRMECVIIQNPVSIAVILAVIAKYFLPIKVLADSHNGAFSSPWKNFPLHKWALRRADVVIIHNKQLLERLKSDPLYSGINFSLLNSKLSNYNYVSKKRDNSEPYILVVCTFAGDEPMELLLQALKYFLDNHPNSVNFKLTGNYKKKPELYNIYKLVHGIEFTGFVSNLEYKNLIVNSEAVISLSTRDDVQQFALMEAISYQVPFISNKNKTNAEMFNGKMPLVNLNSKDIAEGIIEIIQNKKEYKNEMHNLFNDLTLKWEQDFRRLIDMTGIKI